MPFNTLLSYQTDLVRGVNRTPIRPALLTKDSQAHTIRVACVRAGAAVSLSGAAVTGYFVRADGVTVPIVGSTDGNAACVTLTQACYAVPGRFQLVVKASLEDTVATVFFGDGAVVVSQTDTVSDNERIIPSLEELLRQIDDMEAATATAKAALGDFTQLKDDMGNAIKRNARLMTIGRGDIASHVQLDEADQSEGKLYFYATRLCFMTSGYYYDKYWSDILSDLGATETSSANLAKCIEIPNDTALTFNVSSNALEFVHRYAVKNHHLVLFVNAYGRADNMHPSLLKALWAKTNGETQAMTEDIRLLQDDMSSAVKRNARLMTIGAGDIASQVQLDEGDRSEGKLYFYASRLCLMTVGYYFDKYWSDILSDLGATETSSAKLAKCIEIPNDTALTFNVMTSAFEFVHRYAVKNHHLVLFVNAYGRADNMHPSLLKALWAKTNGEAQAAMNAVQLMQDDMDSMRLVVGTEGIGVNHIGMLGPWQVGGLSSGAIAQADYRIVTSAPITLESDLTVRIASGRRMSVHYLHADGSLMEDIGWQTGLHTLRGGVPFMALISAYPETVAEEYTCKADVSEFVKYVTYENELAHMVNGVRDLCVNVKSFGAYGDGVADDAAAIQRAIEYSHIHGGMVVFPKGQYALKTCLFDAADTGVASALHVYSNQKLVFEPGATLLRGSNAVTHMLFSHNDSGATGYDGCENIEIVGATVDENASVCASNDTAFNFSHGKNIRIRNCRFIHAYGNWHSIEVNACKNVEIVGCIFEDNANSEDIQLDAAIGAGNLGESDGTVCTEIRIHNCHFTTGGHPAIGNHTEAAHHDIRVDHNVFHGGAGSRGYVDFVASTYNVDLADNTFHDSERGIVIHHETANSTVHDNRFAAVTTPYSGGVIAYNNLSDGLLIR